MNIVSFVLSTLHHQIAKDALDYPELVNTLQVIKETLASTTSYHEVLPLDTIIQRSDTAKSKLKKMLFYRYREAGIVSVYTTTNIALLMLSMIAVIAVIRCGVTVITNMLLIAWCGVVWL